MTARVLAEPRISAVLSRIADGFAQQLRSPVLHSPSQQNLAYEDVSFPSRDGVPLEGWFIPAHGARGRQAPKGQSERKTGVKHAEVVTARLVQDERGWLRLAG
jgi:hypothetical protein